MNKYLAGVTPNLKNKEETQKRLRQIALKWARIAREKTKEDCPIENVSHRTVPIGAPWAHSA